MVDPAMVNANEVVETPGASFRACAEVGDAWEVIEHSDTVEIEQSMSDGRETYICKEKILLYRGKER